jgi:hypothetical protein
MAALSADEIYEQHVKQLPPAEQLRLAEMITQDITETMESKTKPMRSLLELEGLGAEIWEGIDAQEYVNELRKEWDHRP